MVTPSPEAVKARNEAKAARVAACQIEASASLLLKEVIDVMVSADACRTIERMRQEVLDSAR